MIPRDLAPAKSLRVAVISNSRDDMRALDNAGRLGTRRAPLRGSSRGTVSLPVAFCLGILMTMPAPGQSAKVSLDLSSEVNVLTSSTLSLPALPFDGEACGAGAAPYVHLSGATTIIYPGGHGVADVFHWSKNTLTHVKELKLPYVSPDCNFGNFARNLDKFGSAVIVVNYGSNADGTGGGDGGEAAAWVAYSNGDPSDTRPIPKDENGEDWHTVGFWAALRSASPLPDDDGMNFLRIAHPRPLGIMLWQIGDQVYKNGFYGGEQTGDADLHGMVPQTGKDGGKLEKNPRLSPEFYGSRVVAYAKAMKEVDPNIKIGVPLTTPTGGEESAPGWNSKVLHGACASIDFTSLDWQMGPVLPPDWKTLNEEQLLASSRQEVGNILNGLLTAYHHNCPAGHLPRIAFTPAAIPPWLKVERPIVETIWVADTYAILAETGSETVSWREMHGDSMLLSDKKAFGPAFMGMEMVHVIAHAAGDTFLKADSNNSLVAVHATRRRDGVIGLMLINKDPRSSATVSVSVAGGSIGSKGRRFEYGITQQKAGMPLAQSEINNLGSKFSVEIPPYTVTDILIPALQ